MRTKHSVTDILYVLSNVAEPMKNPKWKPNDTVLKEIEQSLNSLTAPQKESLKKVLLDTWNKFSNLETTTNMPPEVLRNQKITDVIVAMDTANGWKNWMPLWAGGGKKDQLEAMKEMIPNADKWLDITVGEMRAFFVDGTSNPQLEYYLDSDFEKATKQKEIIKRFIKRIPESDDDKLLKDILN